MDRRLCDRCKSETNTKVFGDEAFCRKCAVRSESVQDKIREFLGGEDYLDELGKYEKLYLAFDSDNTDRDIGDMLDVVPLLATAEGLVVAPNPEEFVRRLHTTAGPARRALVFSTYMAIVLWHESRPHAATLKEAARCETNVRALRRGLEIIQRVDPMAVTEVRQRLLATGHGNP